MRINDARHRASAILQGRVFGYNDRDIEYLCRRLYLGPYKGTAHRIASDRALALKVQSTWKEYRNAHPRRDGET